MNYENFGEISIDECNDMNVPVNISIEEDEGKWKLWADNFMPRKSAVTQGAYHVEADTKEILLELVAKHITPLYEVALKLLKTTGELYYWEE